MAWRHAREKANERLNKDCLMNHLLPKIRHEIILHFTGRRDREVIQETAACTQHQTIYAYQEESGS